MAAGGQNYLLHKNTTAHDFTKRSKDKRGNALCKQSKTRLGSIHEWGGHSIQDQLINGGN